jgi:hypothetical protein
MNTITCVEPTLIHIELQVGSISNLYNFKMIYLIYIFIVVT